MTKTVAEKLQIRAEATVLVVGETLAVGQLLQPLPAGAALVDGLAGQAVDVVVLAASDRASLDLLLAEAGRHLPSARAAWIAYPKGNRTDINRDSIWRRVAELGWTLVANVALDEVWSAVRLKQAPPP